MTSLPSSTLSSATDALTGTTLNLASWSPATHTSPNAWSCSLKEALSLKWPRNGSWWTLENTGFVFNTLLPSIRPSFLSCCFLYCDDRHTLACCHQWILYIYIYFVSALRRVVGKPKKTWRTMSALLASWWVPVCLMLRANSWPFWFPLATCSQHTNKYTEDVLTFSVSQKKENRKPLITELLPSFHVYVYQLYNYVYGLLNFYYKE